MINRKERAFQLFAEGKDNNSPEVRALGLKAKTRANYYYLWKTNPEIGKSKKLSQALAGGESIGSVDEVKGDGKKAAPALVIDPKPIPTPPEPPASPEPKPDSEPEDNGQKTPGPSVDLDLSETGTDENGKKPAKKAIPSKIIGEGIPISVKISVKTLYLYQLAANIQEGLLLGDFIDTCAEDTYRGRGLELGIIKSGGKKDGG